MFRRATTFGLCLALIGPAWSEVTPPAQPIPTAPPAPAGTVMMTVAESQDLALRALAAGRYDIAGDVALTMLREDPESGFGHMVMATVLMRSGNFGEARSAAKLAYRHSDSPRQRHEAARVVAASEAQEERFLLGQLWMRRAFQAAPNDEDRKRSIKEFRALKQAAKLKFQISGEVVPSSNVNNGSADRFNVVDGLPIVGILPSASQALPGTITTLSGNFSYRLHGDARSQTRAIGGAQLRRIWLNDEARDIAPDAKNSDFGSSYAQLGLSHHRAIGDKGALAGLTVSFGRLWYAGDRSHDVASAGLSFGFPVSKQLRLMANADRQIRFNDAAGLADVNTTGLRLSVIQSLGNGDRLSLSVGTTLADSENGQSRSTAKSARLAYQRAKPVGPISLSASMEISETIYEDYMIAFFAVPDGRKDMRKAAELNMTIDKLDYAGFVPVVTLSAERTDSNVSRFETEEVSVSVGFRSAF